MFQDIQAILPPIVQAATSYGRWHAGLGDPTMMGVATTVSYFAAGLLCARRAWVSRRDAALRGKPFRFWTACALIMLALCVNKQLDLQTLFTEIGRDLAKAEGWYNHRRPVQAAFIAGLALAGIAALAYVLWFIRGARFQYYLALVGLLFTGCFVITRAASIHHVDEFLRFTIAGIKMNWVMELSGITVVTVSALFPDRPSATEDGG
jgi:hypothetical protein